MRYTGAHGFAKSAQDIWDLLNDPAFLTDVIPGCHRFEQTAPNLYDVGAAFEFGPLSLKAKGQVTLSPTSPPTHYSMAAKVKTLIGRATGTADIELREIPGGTAFHYDANIDLGNALAKLGATVLTGTVDGLTTRFFDRLAVKMETTSIPVP